MQSKYKICICVPCWGRPARTRRVINNILSQTENNWEAFIIGDGCPMYQTMIESGEVEYFKKTAESYGNKIHMFNLYKNYGGNGYYIINYSLLNNKSNYIIFAGNDDIISSDHFSHYLSEIEHTDYDMVAYQTYIKPENRVRHPKFDIGGIGHSEIIVKSDVAKNFLHNPEYGHDGVFILDILNSGAKIKVADSNKQTYTVTGLLNGQINSDLID